MMETKIAKEVLKKWKEIGLTRKQVLFLANYISNGFNAGKAYLEVPGRNAKISTAYVAGCNTLKRPKIQKAFEYWKDLSIDELKGKIEPVIADQYFKRATYDITTFQNDDGTFKALKEIPAEWRCCIDGTEQKYYGKEANVCVVISKLADRDKAMKELSNYVEMIKKRTDKENVLSDSTMSSLMEKLRGK